MNMSAIVVRYGELALKTHSIRKFFTEKLVENIQKSLLAHRIEGFIEEERGRIYVFTDDRRALDILRNVFGIVSVSWSEVCASDMEEVASTSVSVFKPGNSRTFAVRATRHGNHGYTSQELAAYVGERILEKYPDLRVNLKNPDKILYIEVRDRRAFVFSDKLKGPGGLPVGTQGAVFAELRTKDDAAAAWMLLKRGCTVFCSGNEEYIEALKAWGARDSRDDSGHFLAYVSGGNDCRKKSGAPVFCPLIGTDDSYKSGIMDFIFS